MEQKVEITEIPLSSSRTVKELPCLSYTYVMKAEVSASLDREGAESKRQGCFCKKAAGML